MTTKDLNALIERLPHRPPMRMIDAVVEAATGRAVCLVRVADELCRLFGDGTQANAYCAIEALAQAAAIALAFGETENAPQQGMLVQVGKFESAVESFEKGSTLRLEVNVDLGLGGTYALVNGQVFAGDRALCSAKLSIAVGMGDEMEA